MTDYEKNPAAFTAAGQAASRGESSAAGAGAGAGGGPSPSSSPSSSYASVFMQNRDKLRLLQFPAEIVAGVEQVVRRAWPAGIQSQGRMGDVAAGGRNRNISRSSSSDRQEEEEEGEETTIIPAYEFKLDGYPFGTTGEKDGLATRRMLRDVMAFLYQRGWLLATAVSTSNVVGCKDTLVFRRRRRGGEPPPPVDWLILAPNGSDRLRVLGGGGGGANGGREEEASRLIMALRSALEAHDAYQSGSWDDAASSSSPDTSAGAGAGAGTGTGEFSFSFKLRGWPWSCASGTKRARAELVLLAAISVLDARGWRAYGSARCRTETDSVKKADTLFFVRARDWVAGSPFNGEPVGAGGVW